MKSPAKKCDEQARNHWKVGAAFRLGLLSRTRAAASIAFASVLLFLLGAAGGCSFFQAPAERSKESLIEQVDWLSRKPPDLLAEPCAVRRAIKPGLRRIGCTHVITPPKEIADVEFLHISDAQIRDQSLYEETPYDLTVSDMFLDVTVRRPLVEHFDSLVLAAFLEGYDRETRPEKRDHQKEPKPDKCRQRASADNYFIVHTGDLVDISTVTEVMEAMNVLELYGRHSATPVYSIAGNHDGLTFGNLRDESTDTRGLGINRAEFIAAHLLQSPEVPNGHDGAFGYGFGLNEIVALVPKSCKVTPPCTCPSDSTLEWQADRDRFYCIASDGGPLELPKCSAPGRAFETNERNASYWSHAGLLCDELEEVYENRRELRTAKKRHQLLTPIAYRRAIQIASEADANDLHLGYYSWSLPIADVQGLNGVRFVALDMRSRFFASGDIDWVQLGWLYNELRASLAERQAVVVFSHHAPDDVAEGRCIPWMAPRTGCVLGRMLNGFPNVAGYFYGHGHENPVPKYEPFPVIQTGSLADFPQVGRIVQMYASADPRDANAFGVEFLWSFVEARGESEEIDGIALHGVLKTSRKDAEKELASRSPWRKYASKVLPFLAFEGMPRWPEWAADNLPPGLTKKYTIRFPDGLPEDLTPGAFFGGRLEEVSVARCGLGLSGVTDTANCPAREPNDKPSWPQPVRMALQETSGIAVVRSCGRGILVTAADEPEGGFARVELADHDRRMKLDFDGKVPNDIEALATDPRDATGRTLIVVTSHGRNKEGELKPSRSRIVRVRLNDGCTGLEVLKVLGESPGSRDRILAALGGSVPAPEKAEAEADRDLDVEGAAVRNGHLLLGLRAPLRNGEAIVLDMGKVEHVFSDDPPAATIFTVPLFDRGIRDMTASGGVVLLLAGPSKRHDNFQVHAWQPNGGVDAVDVEGLDELVNPEGVALLRRNRLLVAQDVQAECDGDTLAVLPIDGDFSSSVSGASVRAVANTGEGAR